MAFQKSKWIWLSEGEALDQYAEFYDKVNYFGNNVEMNISVSSDYALFVNGVYVASNQYGDYEHYKIYDTLDITSFLMNGENEIKILAYYCGAETSRHSDAKAGLIYDIVSDGEIVGYSSESTLSRLCPTYKSGDGIFVSGQLGFTFSYDATREGYAIPCKSSVVVQKDCVFFPRPIEKQKICKRRDATPLTPKNDANFLLDLGGEVVGLPTFELYSGVEQEITVAWGEHIADGCIRKEIGGRHFFFKYKAKKGKNTFTEYMLRLGCRYIEIYADEPIELSYIGLLPQIYETVTLDKKIDDDTEKRIYDICVNSLRLCMMEHYVDCPWREQALYSFDSRNQMLCGYYAFLDGNREYARANLKLIGQDRREDKILSICHPCATRLAIPSFSLYYILAIKEYIEHTNDVTLGREVFAKLCDILDVFVSRIKDGVVCRFGGEWMWNFYDWSKFSEGTLFHAQSEIPDLSINCLLIIALEKFKYICKSTGNEFPYADIPDILRASVKERFLCDNGCFTMHEGEEEFTVLGNSLALLAGVVAGDAAEYICDKLTSGEMCDCSLSMKVLEYEAMMEVNKEKYAAYIRGDIRKNYTRMLDFGSDTAWETQDGVSLGGEGGAGSLCHGWSAVPVYIYHKLGIVG